MTALLAGTTVAQEVLSRILALVGVIFVICCPFVAVYFVGRCLCVSARGTSSVVGSVCRCFFGGWFSDASNKEAQIFGGDDGADDDNLMSRTSGCRAPIDNQPYGPLTNYCNAQRVRMRNSAGMIIGSPFCEQHVDRCRGRRTKKLHMFEQGKYTLTLWARRRPPKKLRTLLCAELKQALERRQEGKAEAGSIYLFRSQQDLGRVNLADDGDPRTTEFRSTPYLVKIGMTRRKTAAQRVMEWDDSVFYDVRGGDWWPVDDALSAEQLIHTVLMKRRLHRFNKETGQFEIEWFCGTHDELVGVISAVCELFAQKQINAAACEKWSAKLAVLAPKR